jgi:hypothetical protein
MPRGPRGEKRPADVIGAAVMVARIATGEVEDTKTEMRASSEGWNPSPPAGGSDDPPSKTSTPLQPPWFFPA